MPENTPETQPPSGGAAPEQRMPSKAQLLKATFVNLAMVEVLNENRAEIVKRAAAKLRAAGVEVTEKELEIPETKPPA